jgi:PAB-dependent poly(A)-specific ribonuclease subunit 2
MFYACTAGQEFLAINSQTGDVVRRSPTVSIYSHLVNGTNIILSGGSDGFIRSHDPRTSTTVNAVQAHVSGVQGLLTSGNFICSIGLGTRYGAHPLLLTATDVYSLGKATLIQILW